MESIVKLDSKGRILIPAKFRRDIGIKPFTELILMPGKKGKSVSMMPLREENAARCTLMMSDSHSGLSNVMEVLEMLNIGVLMSESRNLAGNGTSEWTFILDTSRSSEGSDILLDRLSELKSVKSASIDGKRVAGLGE